MIEALIIEESELSPGVNFDASTDSLSVSGRSLPEDSRTFYKPIIDWLSEYVAAKEGKVNLEIHLSYFNSSSAKQLLKMLYILEDQFDAGKEVEVNWVYDKNDVMILERGEELAQLVEIPFQFNEHPG